MHLQLDRQRNLSLHCIDTSKPFDEHFDTAFGKRPSDEDFGKRPSDEDFGKRPSDEDFGKRPFDEDSDKRRLLARRQERAKLPSEIRENPQNPRSKSVLGGPFHVVQCGANE